LQVPPGGVFVQPVPGPEVGHALAPAPPWADTVRPVRAVFRAVNRIEPPAPPPPAPSFSGAGPTAPFAVIVPVPETLPTRIMTIPPPAAPLDRSPELLLRVPAPPPAPIATRAAVAGKATPP